VTEGVREIMTRPCPTCDGDGVILSEETIAIEFERRLRDLARERGRSEAMLVRMNPRVASQFTGNGARMLQELEDATGKRFHFEGSEGLPLDHFDIVLEGSRDEVEERALPFREGEEVLVQIVEPHMYNVDDAVAKIDGYIISVTAGGRHVGEKRLVRIDEVGRTAATASLVDDGASPQDEATGGGGGDDVQSRPRRRGRRGGRRRSRARGSDGAGDSGTSGDPTAVNERT
jgi:ribonuclease G